MKIYYEVKKLSEEEQISFDLKVRNSDIERVGIVRINDKTLTKLGVEEGERVVISKGEKSIIRKAFGDEAVKKDEIFIRSKGREELDIEPGDIVKVEDFETIGEEVKEKLGDFKEYVKEGAGDIKEKIGEGVDKIKDKFGKEEDE